MSDYAKRPEITVNTMGRVSNPDGKLIAPLNTTQKPSTDAPTTAESTSKKDGEPTEKQVIANSTKRNITRKNNKFGSSSKSKKMGGHSKKDWNELMDPSEVYEAEADVEEDYQQESNYVLVSKNPEDPSQTIVYDELDDKLTLVEFKQQINEVIHEYFSSLDLNNLTDALVDLHSPKFMCEFVKKLLTISMDLASKERELVSQLLVHLCNYWSDQFHAGHLLDSENLLAGFELTLLALPDLVIDIPDGCTLLANFLARAVVDEIITPAGLVDLKEEVDLQENEEGQVCIEHTLNLLSLHHSPSYLAHIWKSTLTLENPNLDLDDIKKSMDLLLKEYLMSNELDEAGRCVRELDCWFYLHELVKRGCKVAMEDAHEHYNTNNCADTNASDGSSEQSSPSALQRMCSLFRFLLYNDILSQKHVDMGFVRVKDQLDDWKLDMPGAPKYYDDMMIDMKLASQQRSVENGNTDSTWMDMYDDDGCIHEDRVVQN